MRHERSLRAIVLPIGRLPPSLFVMALLAAAPVGADPPWPAFEATALTGETVQSHRLVGQPTLLIVTPSRAAAGNTRAWVTELRGRVDRSAVRVRDVIAVNLPFFISLDMALGEARNRVPERYHEQTWLMDDAVLERALGIPPGAADAYVFALDRQGNVVARVSGRVSDARLRLIDETLAGLTDDPR
jgi:hypothetical protein